ncbi:MAG: ATP-binding cassette domain-containing protein, partial [Deferrisomatales bacterium]
GFTPRTSGEIRFDGREVAFGTPAEATRLGIGMLYQDPLDFPALTNLENFMVGHARGALPSAAAHRAELGRLARELGFTVDPDHPLETLTVGARQQLELLRLLALGVGTLILDEPTTGISAVQKEALFAALRRLADQGRSVVLVSHKLEDVEALCDRVTVLRRGAVTGEAERPFDTGALLGLMFGEPPAPPVRAPAPRGPVALALRDVWAGGDRSGLKGCDLEIRAGEVVGLAGVEGSGQGVFLRVAAGLKPVRRGRVEVGGRPLGRNDHRRLQRDGVAFVPGGRLEVGLVVGLTVREHWALNRPRLPFLIPWARAQADAEEAIARFRIRGSPESRVEALSGGNQQRLLLSFLPPDPRLLLLENPTRGLDLESALRIWGDLKGPVARGAALVFSSAELDEILLVADRVLVFFDGVVVLDTPADRVGADELGRAIAGKAA